MFHLINLSTLVKGYTEPSFVRHILYSLGFRNFGLTSLYSMSSAKPSISLINVTVNRICRFFVLKPIIV